MSWNLTFCLHVHLVSEGISKWMPWSNCWRHWKKPRKTKTPSPQDTATARNAARDPGWETWSLVTGMQLPWGCHAIFHIQKLLLLLLIPNSTLPWYWNGPSLSRWTTSVLVKVLQCLDPAPGIPDNFKLSVLISKPDPLKGTLQRWPHSWSWRRLLITTTGWWMTLRSGSSPVGWSLKTRNTLCYRILYDHDMQQYHSSQ